ncbi:hypothetical protein [Streptomyces ureilyticus]|uniref:Uncharacterized protein n=1 Tax=Streptomyces ureilyticus TaxID=1775131 RepID=A0ABX0DYJ2_9ACTN|nr:hypothetical protein [Streptomyces ureilyticus]NGO47022.1 hypothetical protein [Streptomyces ureilyticus]
MTQASAATRFEGWELSPIEHLKREGPATGSGQPSQKLAAALAANRYRAALGIRDLDRSEHLDEDLHVLIVDGFGLPLLIHC